MNTISDHEETIRIIDGIPDVSQLNYQANRQFKDTDSSTRSSIDILRSIDTHRQIDLLAEAVKSIDELIARIVKNKSEWAQTPFNNYISIPDQNSIRNDLLMIADKYQVSVVDICQYLVKEGLLLLEDEDYYWERLMFLLEVYSWKLPIL
jgi:hypothetical protein